MVKFNLSNQEGLFSSFFFFFTHENANYDKKKFSFLFDSILYYVS